MIRLDGNTVDPEILEVKKGSGVKNYIFKINNWGLNILLIA